MKKPLISKAIVSFYCFGLTACSNFNETVWHSLKAHDAYQHPSLENTVPESKSLTFEQYANERKQALEK